MVSSLDDAGRCAVQEGMTATTLRLPPLLLALLLPLPLTGCDVDCKWPSRHARETVLHANLRTLRDVIAQYRGDKGRYPETLGVLIEAGYLRRVPIDPMTCNPESWIPVYAPAEAKGRFRGIADVRSGAEGRGTDGRLYREW